MDKQGFVGASWRKLNIPEDKSDYHPFGDTDMASLRSADMLPEYGYSILVMPTGAVRFPRDKISQPAVFTQFRFLFCPFFVPQDIRK